MRYTTCKGAEHNRYSVREIKESRQLRGKQTTSRYLTGWIWAILGITRHLAFMLSPFSTDVHLSLKNPSLKTSTRVFYPLVAPGGHAVWEMPFSFSVGPNPSLPGHVFLHRSVTALCSLPSFLFCSNLPALSETFSACRCINRAVFN